jgi:hypothetical protein
VAGKSSPRTWQLRLAPDEDDLATKLADERMVSKNEVIRRALRLLAKLEQIASAGGRLYIARRGGKREPFEVWLL